MLKKISILFISLLVIILVSTNVFGYDLKFDGSVEGDYVVFYNSVKSSGRAKTNYNSTDWSPMIDTDAGDAYRVTGLWLQGSPFTTYSSSGEIKPVDENGYYITNSNYNVVNYDKFSRTLNMNNVETYFSESNNLGTAKLSSENISDHYEISREAEKFIIECKLYGASNEYLITRYRIKKSVFELDEVKKLINKNDNSIYVSFITSYSENGRMETAYQFYDSIFRRSSTATNLSRMETTLADLNTQIKELDEQLIQNRNTLANMEALKEYSAAEYDRLKAQIEEQDAELLAKKSELASIGNQIREVYTNLKISDTDSVWSPYVKGVFDNGYYARGYSAVNDYDNILYLTTDKNVKVSYQVQEEDDFVNSEHTTDIPSKKINEYRIKDADRNYDAYEEYNLPILVQNKATFAKLLDLNKVYYEENNRQKRLTGKYDYVGYVLTKRNSSESEMAFYQRHLSRAAHRIDLIEEPFTDVQLSSTEDVYITFIYEPKAEKKVFVNYLVRDQDNNLTEIEVAPKENEVEKSVDGKTIWNIHFVRTSNNAVEKRTWFGITEATNIKVVKDNYPLYEEYDVKYSDYSTGEFHYMTEEELKDRLNNDYKYKHYMVTSGNDTSTYDELMKTLEKNYRGNGNTATSVTTSDMSNSRNILISFIYELRPDKEVYVNYLLEKQDGTLINLNVAPKNDIYQPEDSDMYIGIHDYSTDRGRTWKDLTQISESQGIKNNRSDNNKEYENYSFKEKVIDTKNIARLIRMSDEELINSTGKNSYTYDRVMYLYGDVTDTYDSLYTNMINPNYEKQEIKEDHKEVRIDDINPVMVSFVYKEEPKKTIYVNYLEKMEDGSLKVIEVAPKDQVYKLETYGNIIHGYSKDGNNTYTELRDIYKNSSKDSKYELYYLNKEKDAKAKIIRMADDELNSKDNINKTYKYTGELRYYNSESPNTSYLEMLSAIRDENISETAKANAATISLKNNNVTMVSFIYESNTKERDVYVDYVEEVNGGFSNLKIAPRDINISGEHRYTLDGTNFHNFSFRDLAEYKNVSKNRSSYEQYKIQINTIQYPQKKVSIKNMNINEVNSKLEESGTTYKFLRLNYLVGDYDDDYESLSSKIYNKNAVSNSSIGVTMQKSTPVLVSFVYTSSNKKNFLVEVEHKSESGEVLPIADYGNYVTTPYISFSKSTTLASYSLAINSLSRVVELTSKGKTYTDEAGNKYNSTGKYKVEYYYENATKPAYGKDYSNTSFSFHSDSIAKVFKRIKVIFYYKKSDTPPPPPGDDDFDPCPKLSFVSSFINTKSNCEEGNNTYIGEEGCYDDKEKQTKEKANTNYLTMPTGESLTGVIETPKYAVRGLKYYIQVNTKRETNIEYSYSYTTSTDTEGNYRDTTTEYYSSYTECEDGEEIPCQRSRTVAAPHTSSSLSSTSYNSKYQESKKWYENLVKNGTQDLGGIPGAIHHGYLTKCKTGICQYCNQSYYISIEEGDFYDVNYVSLYPIIFNSYYLISGTLKNYSNDSARLIGGNRENITNEELYIDVENDLLETLKDRFARSGSSSSLAGCASDDGWERGYISEYDPSTGEAKFTNYDYPICKDGGEYMKVLHGDRDVNVLGTYNTKTIRVDDDKFNGERVSIAEVVYWNYTRKLNEGANLVNVGVGDFMSQEVSDSFSSEDDKDDSKSNTTPITVTIDNKTLTCSDIPDEHKSDTTEITSLYEDEENTTHTIDNTNTSGVNIADSVTLDKPIMEHTTDRIVSQTLGSNKVFNLQQGVETYLVPRLATTDSLYGSSFSLDARKNFIKCYVYYFNFPVQIKNGPKLDANTPYVKYVDGNDYVAVGADAYSDSRGAIYFTPIGEENNRVTTSGLNYRQDELVIMALTKNVPINEIETFYRKAYEVYKDNSILTKKYYGISEICEDPKPGPNNTTRNDFSSTLTNLGKSIRNDAYYVSNIVKVVSTNISRVYGFKITDCTDVNYKNVFRKNTDSSVNEHTGTVYTSGIRDLDVFTNKYNNVNENTILPLGPYKQVGGYVDAPKIGYRFSFDLKTSGYYDYNSTDQKRTIVIFPQLYYLSKDGTSLIENVDAYYKNSSGKYQKITQIAIPQNDDELRRLYIDYARGSGSLNGYKLSYIPNDGYRNVLNIGITQLTDMFTRNKIELDMSAIILKKQSMCTNNLLFVQSWYGEYKLPNSTILVKSGETNLNNQLTDGYLGVIFNIGVVEEYSTEDPVVISYNTSDKMRAEAARYNSTEWDYEGYLGFPQTSYGNKLTGTLKLQLAKGIMNITDDIYQKIKGTVMLYDIDNRAASDFE